MSKGQVNKCRSSVSSSVAPAVALLLLRQPSFATGAGNCLLRDQPPKKKTKTDLCEDCFSFCKTVVLWVGGVGRGGSGGTALCRLSHCSLCAVPLRSA